MNHVLSDAFSWFLCFSVSYFVKKPNGQENLTRANNRPSHGLFGSVVWYTMVARIGSLYPGLKFTHYELFGLHQQDQCTSWGGVSQAFGLVHLCGMPFGYGLMVFLCPWFRSFLGFKEFSKIRVYKCPLG